MHQQFFNVLHCFVYFSCDTKYWKEENFRSDLCRGLRKGKIKRGWVNEQVGRDVNIVLGMRKLNVDNICKRIFQNDNWIENNGGSGNSRINEYTRRNKKILQHLEVGGVYWNSEKLKIIEMKWKTDGKYI